MGFLYNPIKSHKSAPFVTFFFVALCVFSLIMVVFLSIKRKDIAVYPQIGRFEVVNFEYFKITKKGVDTIANGRMARENARNENILEFLSVQNINENVQEHLQADSALYNNSDVFFPQGVRYIRDTTQLWSEQARYYPASKHLEGFGNFTVFDKNTTIRGRNLVYKDAKIYAKNIRAILKATQ